MHINNDLVIRKILIYRYNKRFKKHMYMIYTVSHFVLDQSSDTDNVWREGSQGGHLLYFYSIMSVHWIQKCTLNTDQIYTKLRSFSSPLPKNIPLFTDSSSHPEINWAVLHWVLSKQKSRSCGIRQPTFNFFKILPELYSNT